VGALKNRGVEKPGKSYRINVTKEVRAWGPQKTYAQCQIDDLSFGVGRGERKCHRGPELICKTAGQKYLRTNGVHKAEKRTTVQFKKSAQKNHKANNLRPAAKRCLTKKVLSTTRGDAASAGRSKGEACDRGKSKKTYGRWKGH